MKIPPCNSHAETVNGAKLLARKLEAIFWRPNSFPAEAGKCRLCGSELKIVYYAWDISGPVLESLHATREMTDRIKKCEGSKAKLEEMNIQVFPNLFCDATQFKVVDPGFWKKDEETGYHYNGGIPDGPDDLVTPWMYALRNVDRTKFIARKRFAETNNRTTERKVAPLDRL